MSDTAKIRIEFDITLDRLVWGDLIFLEAPRSWGYALELAAKFMVDADGVSIPFERAKRILRGLDETQSKQTIADLITAVREARQNAVPPTSAG